MRKLLPCVLFPLFVSCGSGDPGPQGLTGPGGDPGPPGPTGAPGPQGTVPPTLNGLTPLTAFPDRVVTLQLSGVGTHFGKDTVVRFTDPALHVTKVTAASAGYLQAELHLDPSATLGPQDLTVEGPGVDPSGMPTGTTERATLQGALRVVPSLQADGNGTTAMATQGGLFDFSLIDLDRDTALAGSGRLEGGARAIHLTTLGGRLAGTALVDALATGGLALHAVYSKGGTDTAFVADGNASTSPHVSARAAKPLTAGTAITGETLAMPRQTNLYKLITSADEQVAVLSFATSGSLATNTVAGAAAPSSGRWNDGQFFYASTNMAAQTALVYMAAKGDQFLTVLAANLGGAADYGYDLTARVATAKAFSSKENAMMPDTPAMPLATVTLDAPQHSSDGAMDGPADIDYIRFQATKAGRAYVQAVVPGQGLGVPAVTVALRAADCTTALAPPRPVQQEVTVAAGTSYCAVVSSPSSYAGPYRLILAQDL